jgi:uncharacterized RDD family membrane protein YckC
MMGMEFWEDYETLRIETPEGLDLFLPLAGFGPRFLAFFIDMIGVSIAQVILIAIGIGIAVGAQLGAASGPDDVGLLMIIILAVLLIVFLLAPVFYFMLFESLWSGQTPGKRLAGIRVIRRGGFPVGRREVLLRNLLRIIDMLPSNWIVGLVSFFATQNQQRVGDVAADTVVVREFSGRRPVTSPMAYDGNVADLHQPAHALSPQLAYAIGSYLQRLGELSPPTREQLSLRCIEALGYTGSHLSLEQREGYLASIMRQQWAGNH